MSHEQQQQEQKTLITATYQVTKVTPKSLGTISFYSKNGEFSNAINISKKVDIIELVPVNSLVNESIVNDNNRITYKAANLLPSIELSIGDPELAKQFYPGRTYTLTLG